ncbi:short transient receptor potential channel 4 isoform X2 [Nematostella vectensis]|nr:short transient receptor potential channel 4 isoform X2 [Nematostella vectensis]
MESGLKYSAATATLMFGELHNGFVRPLWLTQESQPGERPMANGGRGKMGCDNPVFRNADALSRDGDRSDANGFLVNHQSRLESAMVSAARDNDSVSLGVALDHYMELLNMEGLNDNNPGDPNSHKPKNFLPLVVAAQLGNYEVLNMLVSKGFQLVKPHNVLCRCEECQADNFRESQRRLDIYRGLANPVFISMTSNDPFLTAFELSSELEVIARREDEYEKDYLQLSQQCSQFTIGLLDECRTSREQRCILNYPGENGSVEDYAENSLGLVNSAISYNQKEFVAHPFCQHLVMQHIFGDITGWRTNHFLYRIAYVLTQVIIFPVLAVIYFFMPFLEVGRKIKRPFVKFINHTSSFVVFLILLAVSSHHQFEIRFRKMPSGLEWLIFSWILGVAWSECKQVWHEGARRYFSSGWNWMDIGMVFLLLGAFVLWTIIFIVDFDSNAKLAHDVLLSTADGMYAFGVVASFFRLIYLCQISRYLGLLQLSLSRMVRVIFQFAFISCVVLWSFSVAMTMLYMSSFEAYQLPRPVKNVTSDIDAILDKGYDNLLSTMVTLMWASLDMVGLDTLNVFKKQSLIQFWTAALFTLYHAASMVVLLNMLIAMMSNSYQQVEDNIETEYKFARTQLWTDYIGDAVPTLPPPLNLLPTPKYIVRLLCKLSNRCCGVPRKVPCLTESQVWDYDGGRFDVEHRKSEYKSTVRELLSRYWDRHRKAKTPATAADRIQAMTKIKEEVTDMLCEIRNILKARGRTRGSRDQLKAPEEGEPASQERIKLELTPPPSSSSLPELSSGNTHGETNGMSAKVNGRNTPSPTGTEGTNHNTAEGSSSHGVQMTFKIRGSNIVSTQL